MQENNARTKLPSPASTDNDDQQPVSDTTEPSANSFLAEIKSAAHQAQNETGFIYEPTSGLYYDSRTGYYYNAVSVDLISTKKNRFAISILRRNLVEKLFLLGKKLFFAGTWTVL